MAPDGERTIAQSQIGKSGNELKSTTGKFDGSFRSKGSVGQNAIGQDDAAVAETLGCFRQKSAIATYFVTALRRRCQEPEVRASLSSAVIDMHEDRNRTGGEMIDQKVFRQVASEFD